MRLISRLNNGICANIILSILSPELIRLLVLG